MYEYCIYNSSYHVWFMVHYAGYGMIFFYVNMILAFFLPSNSVSFGVKGWSPHAPKLGQLMQSMAKICGKRGHLAEMVNGLT